MKYTISIISVGLLFFCTPVFSLAQEQLEGLSSYSADESTQAASIRTASPSAQQEGELASPSATVHGSDILNQTDKTEQRLSPSQHPSESPALSPSQTQQDFPKEEYPKQSLVDRLQDAGVTDYIQRGFVRRAQQGKDSRSSLQSSSSVKPSHMIQVDMSEINEETENAILSYVEELQSQGISMTLYVSNQADSLFLYTYDTEESTYQEMKERFREREAIRTSPNRMYERTYTPNDTYYANQWNLSKINWSSAMDIALGNPEVIIAIMDNGVEVSDADLSTRVWTNTGEIAGDNIDNDGNGYIDDMHGCNFYKQATGDPTTACDEAGMSDAGDRHGTYGAMVMGPSTNNSFGVASLCPMCRVMVLDVDDGDGAYLSDVVAAMDYAVAEGAKAVNFSYASGCPFDSSEDVIDTQIDTFINTYNVSFVQAVGNNGSFTQSDCTTRCGATNSYCTSNARNQAYYYIDGKNVSNKINVAATTSTDARASFSTYDGTQKVITVAAPGSSVPVAVGGSLVYVSGTSFAAPHVTAAVGFSYSEFLANGATPSAAQIFSLLRSTADTISTDQDISGKRINLYQLALQSGSVATITPSPTQIPGSTPISTQTANPVYRFWSDLLQSHFYTISAVERDIVLSTYDDSVWRYEGITYYAYASQVSNTTPVYRFWSDILRGHFYTASTVEKDYVIANYQGIWVYEGIAYYVYPSTYSVNTKPVYRFWSDLLQGHFYTASTIERDYVISQFDDFVWRYEGIAWNVPL